MTPLNFIIWSVAIGISSIFIAYGIAVLYAAVKTFIIQPRDVLKYREHSRRMLEIQMMKETMNGESSSSRILCLLLEKCGGELEMKWSDVELPEPKIIFVKQKDARTVIFSTKA